MKNLFDLTGKVAIVIGGSRGLGKGMAKYKEKIPMGRLGTPEDMATTAVFLAADASAYVTGQMIYVDGGWLVN